MNKPKKDVFRSLFNGQSGNGTPIHYPMLKEGQKVKLNIGKIMKESWWERSYQNYKLFVISNKNTIFTVEYEPKYGENPIIVSLKEDPSEIKWSWFIGDLDVVDEEVIG